MGRLATQKWQTLILRKEISDYGWPGEGILAGRDVRLCVSDQIYDISI